jgi:hypothetical protein
MLELMVFSTLSIGGLKPFGPLPRTAGTAGTAAKMIRTHDFPV